MLAFDRFECGPSDPQDAPVLAHCKVCGGEFYPFQKVCVIGKVIVHAEEVETMTIEEALGVF